MNPVSSQKTGCRIHCFQSIGISKEFIILLNKYRINESLCMFAMNINDKQDNKYGSPSSPRPAS